MNFVASTSKTTGGRGGGTTAASIVRENEALRVIVADGVPRQATHAFSGPASICVLEGSAVGWRVAGAERWIDATGLLLLNAFVPFAQLGGPSGKRRIVTAMFRRRWIEKHLAGRRGVDPQRPFAKIVTPIAAEVRARFVQAADAGDARALEAAMTGLATALLETNAATDVPNPARAFDYRIRRAIDLAALRPDRRVSVDDMIAASRLSRSRFFELFGECLGMAPQEYLDALALEAALDALGSADTPVGKLSRALGFSNPDGFTRFVRREIGVTPRAYRKALRGA
jgi:AraC-like DNA-binding protein